MDYEACELLLDGLEDYLKGPTFIETASGEDIIKRQGAKNEKLLPISELGRGPEGVRRGSGRLEPFGLRRRSKAPYRPEACRVCAA